MNRLNVISNSTQFFIMIAVIGSVIAGGAMIIAGFVSIIKASWDLIAAGSIDLEIVRSFSVEVIEVADAFLIGVVMFIVAIGLYQLFFETEVEIPAWLEVTTLDDLKKDLLAVTIVVLGITFLGRVVDWDGSTDIIYFGAAIAIVLVPLVAMFAVLIWATESEDTRIKARMRREKERDTLVAVEESTDALAKALKERGIFSAPRYIRKPAFRCEVIEKQRTFGNSRFPFNLARPEAVDYRQELFPGTFESLATILVLPWNEHYQLEHVEFIAQSITDCVRELQT